MRPVSAMTLFQAVQRGQVERFTANLPPIRAFDPSHAG